VEVHRRVIFIEESIQKGIRWVVHEPNAEALWARVRRSVTDFLTNVWRDGALESGKAEEGFFVKCDRTTITQNDASDQAGKSLSCKSFGAVAQLGEHLLCKQGVAGSIPVRSIVQHQAPTPDNSPWKATPGRASRRLLLTG